MKAIIINRKTSETDKFTITRNSIKSIKTIAGLIAANGSKYSITVIAENNADLDFMSTNFHNIPIPAAPARRAIWVGDLAAFILANFPKDFP